MAHLTPKQRSVFFALMLTLFVVIAMAALAVALGFFPKASEAFKTGSVPTLLVDIVGGVILAWRVEFGNEAYLVASVSFSGSLPPNVKLDMARCTYELFDSFGAPCRKGTPVVSKGPGGWQCKIPADPRGDTARLMLVEEDGTQWRVTNFGTMSVAVEATKT